MEFKNYILFGIVFAITVFFVEAIVSFIRLKYWEIRRWLHARKIPFDIFWKSYHRIPDQWDIIDSPLYVKFSLNRYNTFNYRLTRRSYYRDPDAIYYRFSLKEFWTYIKWRKKEFEFRETTAYDAAVFAMSIHSLSHEISEREYEEDREFDKDCAYIYSDGIVNGSNFTYMKDYELPLSQDEIDELRCICRGGHATNYYYIRDKEKKIDYEIIVEDEKIPNDLWEDILGDEILYEEEEDEDE
jgi:hypothetical protein